MTIDEAIEHAEEVARICDDSQCAKDHAQLADWLRELRRARMEIDLLNTLRGGFKSDAQKYKAENAKLREENAKLRVERDEWHRVAKSKQHIIDHRRDAMAENRKLRDFAKSYLAAAGVDCGICPYRDPELCDTETDPMSDGCRLCREMRELGVEVEE